MRIISPFRDYYDCLQAHDEDKKSLYLRNPEKVDVTSTKWPFPVCVKYHSSYRNWSIETKIVGFCGKVYPVVRLSSFDYVPKGFGVMALCRDIEQVDQFFESNSKKVDLAEYYDEKRPSKRYRRSLASYRRYDGKRVSFVQFFKECAEKQDKFGKMFGDKRCPVFIASRAPDGGAQLVWNACLKEVEFFRVFDPAKAYQEVWMWLNNQAVPIKPIPVLDDVTMAEVKGFNKYSFRMDPIRKRKK